MVTEEERASPIGFFLYGDSYLYSAKELKRLDLRCTHPHAPIYFLYHQSIELYLKAFLRQKGQLVRDIRGHKLVPLAEKAMSFGITIEGSDMYVFELLDYAHIAITARYLRVGPSKRPQLQDLDHTCDNVRSIIATEMRRAGHLLRPFPKTLGNGD